MQFYKYQIVVAVTNGQTDGHNETIMVPNSNYVILKTCFLCFLEVRI